MCRPCCADHRPTREYTTGWSLGPSNNACQFVSEGCTWLVVCSLCMRLQMQSQDFIFFISSGDLPFDNASKVKCLSWLQVSHESASHGTSRKNNGIRHILYTVSCPKYSNFKRIPLGGLVRLYRKIKQAGTKRVLEWQCQCAYSALHRPENVHQGICQSKMKRFTTGRCSMHR